MPDKAAANLDIEDSPSLGNIPWRTGLRVVGRLKHITDKETPLQLQPPFINEEGHFADSIKHSAWLLFVVKGLLARYPDASVHTVYRGWTAALRPAGPPESTEKRSHTVRQFIKSMPQLFIALSN